MRRPKITKEIKEQAKKAQELKWDSKNETASEYVDRISQLKKNRKR